MSLNDKQKERIILFGVTGLMILLLVVWVITLKFPQARNLNQDFDFKSYRQGFEDAVNSATERLDRLQKKEQVASSTEPTEAEIKARIEALSKDLEARAGTSTIVVSTSSTSTAEELELQAMRDRLAEIESKLNDKK